MPLTDADIQLLQVWLNQAQVKGPIQVAAQAAPVVHMAPAAIVANAPGVNLAFSPMQPLAAPVQPVMAQPAPVVPVVVAPAPKRTSSFPF
jgi:hypothetical protein